jgi:hypothetical protein
MWRQSHHRYCEHEAWVSLSTLRVRLWGYGEGIDFDTRVTVALMARGVRWRPWGSMTTGCS